MIHLNPTVLQECFDADALVLMQGAWCNNQIPAKAYEYLRVGRPILGLACAAGDTAALLRRTGGATLVDLDDEAGIAAALPDFLGRVRAQSHPRPDPAQVVSYARDRQAVALAETLTQVRETGRR